MPTLSRFRDVIARVPRGRVITYGQVAEAAGFPGAARQTVWALQGATGLPWHRVVGAGGRIALAGVEGEEQRLRLEIEGVAFRGGRVRLDLYGWTPRKRRAPGREARPGRGAGLTRE
ncbi:MAG: MGMT family protein [Thermoplasmata archaeon]